MDLRTIETSGYGVHRFLAARPALSVLRVRDFEYQSLQVPSLLTKQRRTVVETTGLAVGAACSGVNRFSLEYSSTEGLAGVGSPGGAARVSRDAPPLGHWMLYEAGDREGMGPECMSTAEVEVTGCFWRT